MRLASLYRGLRLLGVLCAATLILTLFITKDDSLLSKLPDRSISPSSPLPTDVRQDRKLRNLTLQQVREVNTSLLTGARLMLPSHPARPPAPRVHGFEYADLTGVELMSLDGRYIYDEDPRLPRPDRRSRLPFGRLSTKERVALLQKLRGRDKDTTFLAGQGDVPKCNMSYILHNFNNTGDYSTVRSCDNILFTRTPGSGSSLFMYLFAAVLSKNSEKDKFYMMAEDPPNTTQNVLDRRSMANIVDLFETVDRGLLYTRHIPYVNFTQISPTAKDPIYLSVVREPISRLIAEYLFHHPPGSHKPKQAFEKCVLESGTACTGLSSAVTYFCGHEEICRNGSSRAMLAVAKRTVIEKYLIVGVYSDVGTFTAVLRMLHPTFFQHAPAKLQMALTKRHSPDRAVQAVFRSLKETTRNLLRHKPEVAIEMEFYQFIQQRFYLLYNNMTKKKAGGGRLSQRRGNRNKI